ncbi:MAG: HD family phosphohydrolase [Desulfonatronovibrio sp. MSAO_Bac4]|nr:MAG: HD family phosphohydrolase [Desulfonatronovibrio sp. MSAO_Bac4]
MKQTDIDTQTLNEEFYQISPDILASFPKFRLPLNLYRFDEKISQLAPYYKKGNRLQQEQQREMAKISREGQLFVSREDHKIYAKHISKQLDLVLMDKHLTTGEIVYIIKYALTEKIDDFFEQPVDAALSKLFSDTKVVTEYIISELDNINHLLNQLHEDYSNAHLCYNSSILGLAVFLDAQGEEYKRKALDQLALGLFTHGLGLSRIPKFILEKKTNLTPDEQSKLTNYPMNGAGIMRKLDIMDEIVLNCHLEHKEMMDGSGIPRGMRGNELSLHGKIASVCHAFCELTLIRNDKSLPYNKALEFLTASQQKYDPKITKRLNKIVLKLMGRQQLNKS